MKSGALTAFAALALISSHGACATQTFPMKKAPNGVRTSRAWDTSFTSKMCKGDVKKSSHLGFRIANILGLSKKNNPLYQKKFILGITGALSTAVCLVVLFRGATTSIAKKREAFLEGKDLSCFEFSSEMVEKGADLLTTIGDFLRNKASQEIFKDINQPITRLKRAIEIKNSDEKVMKVISNAIKSLSRIRKSDGAAKIYFELSSVITNMCPFISCEESVPNSIRKTFIRKDSKCKKKAENSKEVSEEEAFAAAIISLSKKYFLGAGKEAALALKKSKFLKGLVDPFKDFMKKTKDFLLSGEYVPSSFASMIWFLNLAGKAKDPKSVLKNLVFACSFGDGIALSVSFVSDMLKIKRQLKETYPEFSNFLEDSSDEQDLEGSDDSSDD